MPRQAKQLPLPLPSRPTPEMVLTTSWALTLLHAPTLPDKLRLQVLRVEMDVPHDQVRTRIVAVVSDGVYLALCEITGPAADALRDGDCAALDVI